MIPTFQPLRRKLPLLFAAVLAGVVFGVCGIAYLQLRAALVAAAEERAVTAAQRIAAALDESVLRARRDLEPVAAEPLVRTALAAPFDAATRAELEALLGAARARSVQLVALSVATRSGKRILTVEAPGAGSAGSRPDGAGGPREPRPIRAGFGPLMVAAREARFDVALPVLGATPADTLGFLVATRRIEGPGNRLIGELIGAGATFRVGNLDGSVWTDLVRPVAGPHEPRDAEPIVLGESQLPSAPWRAAVWVREDAAVAPARRFLAATLSAGTLLLAIAVIAGWRLTRGITRPLEEISAAATDFAAGDYTRRAPAGRPDELGQMAASFNALAERVETAARDRTLRAHELEAANRALQESQSRYRHIAANIPGMVYQYAYGVDGRGTFTVVSDGVRELLGVEPADVLRDPATVFDLVHPEERDAFHSSGVAAMTALRPWHWEGRVVLAGGEEKWIQAASSQDLQPDGSILADGVLLDVTERRRAAQRLEESEVRFHLAARATRDIVYDWDIATDTLFWGDTLTAAFGYHPRDIAPNNGWWIDRIHRDDVARVTSSLERALEGSAEAWSAEYRFRCHDGSWASVLDRAYVLRDDAGHAVRLVGSMSDLTERIQLEEQLRQAQKMEAVGQLAGGVAHDFNNILTAISGYSELLLEGMPTSDSRRDAVTEIRSGAQRAAALTRQLLAFSRRQMLQPRVLDLNRTVGELEKMLRRLIAEDITLIISLDPALGHVRADPGQLEQVLVNLVVNARDAMPTGGSLTVETSNVDLATGEQDAREQGAIPPGSYVRITVSDTGSGMDEDTRARIFEPFFTTKEPGKGTGLGLSTVYGIVKQSGGYIWCYSEPGAGTIFKIYLPRVEARPEKLGAAITEGSRRENAARGAETVLIVEDDAAVRHVTRRILAQQGYIVLEATNGREALRLCEGASPPVDLILSDMVMPEMNGPELGRQVRARHPDTALLFMSGYTEDVALRQSFLEPGTAFIEKPFAPSALAARIRQILDSRPRTLAAGAA